MKGKITLILFLLLAVVLQELSAQTFTRYIDEGFEDGLIPENWSEVASNPSNNAYWTYTEGGGGSPNKPNYSIKGTKNASFRYSTGGYYSWLITKPVDISKTKKPVLSFYFANIQRNTLDFFKVCYKKSLNGEWILLEEYGKTIDWEKREIILPPDAWVSTLYIGFYAKSNNGFGVCLDEVILENREYETRQVDANNIGLWQASNSLPAGSKGYPIAFSRLNVTGNNITLKLSDMKFLYTGTDINDIENFSIFYSRDSAFVPAPSNLLSNVATMVDDTIKFSNIERELPTGKNFIWLCANIKNCTNHINHGNIIDIEIPSNGIKTTLYGEQTTSNTLPATTKTTMGNSKIYESLVVNGFESSETNVNNKWILNGCWEMGKPLGTGNGDPGYSFSGENVLATNLNGNYPAASTSDTVLSPKVFTKYYKNIGLHYARWLNVELNDLIGVYIYANDTMHNLYRNNGGIRYLEALWNRSYHDISRQANRGDSVYIKFAIDESINQLVQRGGWNIDNFAITGDFIALDAGIDSIIPFEMCGLTLAPTTFKVIVRNYGGENISAPFDIGYSLDNGKTFTKKTFSTSLATPRTANNIDETLLEFAFDPVQLTPGLKQLVFKTFLDGDEDSNNDAIAQLLYVFPTIEENYAESFERNNGYWYATGTKSSWAFGTPNGTNLNSASDGNKAWATKLNGNYNKSEKSYLESPCFNLANIPFPTFSFDYNLEVADANDILKIEYSTNSGATWTQLPANDKYNDNWNTTGWNSNSDGFKTAYTLLPDADFGKNGVKFRFNFTSDTSGFAEGAVIDNIKVQALPYDTKLISTNFAPQDACEIGETPISFTLQNVGHRTIVSGTKLPFTIKIDNGSAIQDTITVDADIAKDVSRTLTTTKRYRIANPGTHKVVIASELSPSFEITSDDTLKRDVSVTGMPFYSLGADIGTTEINTITLDGGVDPTGVDYTSYNWELSTDDMATWTDKGNTKTLTGLNSSDYGYYICSVENAAGCTASDTIKVIDSNQDVEISDIINITDACLHENAINPEVTIRHNGGNVFDGSISFKIGLSINGVEVLSEDHTPVSGWSVGSTSNYTFTGSIDISQFQDYRIKAYTKFANDVDKTNDTTIINISTFGPPALTFDYPDTILTTEANSLSLIASCPTAVTYTWERFVDFTDSWSTLEESTGTLAIPDKKSASYRISLTDNSGNNCGTSSDVIYVNTKDIGVHSISMPSDTICFFDDGINIIAEIKNYGDDTYPIGTTFKASAQTAISYQEQTITLQNELAANGTVSVTFPQKVQLMLGDQDINAVIEAKNDVNSLNDSYTRSTHTIPQPTINIDPDTLLMAFGSSSQYEIVPQYSQDCRTYVWGNSEFEGIGTEQNYMISGFPKEFYYVVASNGFCSSSDTIVVRANDIAISEVLTPIDTCASSSTSYPVWVRIKNMGTPLPAGSELTISGTSTTTNALFMQDAPVAISQTINFTEEWESQATMDIKLSPSIVLNGKKTVKIALTVIPQNFDDVVTENNSIEKTALMLSYPSIQFIPDNATNQAILAEADTLEVSTRYFSYKWQDEPASTIDTTYIADSTGVYTLTVTDFLGCSSTKSLNLTFYNNDLKLESLVAPTSACTQPDTSIVTINVKNNGDYTIPLGTDITIGFMLGTSEPHTENYTFTRDFAPNDTINISFKKGVEITTAGVNYSLKTWVLAEHDRITANNELTTTVSHFAPVVISGFDDVETCFGNAVTLSVSGSLGSTPTYEWNTGATTQTISTATAGEYYVTVRNENGCFNSDTLMLTVNDLPVVELVADTAICKGATLTLDAQNSGSSFLWNTATGNNSQTIQVTEAGTYTVTVTDIKGCSKSDSSVVAINQLPPLSLGDDIAFCIGQSATLDAGTGATSYLWNTSETSQTISVSTGGEYWARYTDSNGCSKTDYINITVNPLPTVNLGDDITICGGDTTTLEAITNGTSYLWSTNETTSTIDVSNNTSYWLTITNSNGCQNTDTVSVSFYTPVIVNIGNDTTICANTSITLNANSGNYSYLWSNNSTASSTTASAAGIYSVTLTDLNQCSYSDSITISHFSIPNINLGDDIKICQRDYATITSNLANMIYQWSSGETTQSISTYAEGNYWVRVTDANTCQNSDTVNVSFFTPFTVDLGPDNSFCANTTYTIDAGNAGFSHIWSTGETTQSILASVAGVYSVTVTDANSCTNSDTITLNTYAIPQINIGADTVICRGFSLTLDAGTDGISYLWSNGTTNQTISINSVGSYWARITNSNGCSNSDTLNLSINELPIISLGNDTTICQSLPITLNAGTNEGHPVSYLWNNGQTTQTLTTNVAGTYTATITDANGCSKADAINISVHQPFSVNLGPDISYCIDTIHTIDAGNTGFNYLWSNGQTSQTINVSETNEYSVVVTDPNNCPERDTVKIFFNIPPPLDLGDNVSICSGNSTTLDAGQFGISYIWSTGDTTQTIVVEENGSYSVTIFDIRGCTNHDSINVTVNELPEVSLGNDTEICEGIPFTLSSNVVAQGYLWSNNATTQSIDALVAGQYWLQITDFNGCVNSDTILLSAKAKPEIFIGNDTSVCVGSTINLSNSSNASNYLWNNGSTDAVLVVTVNQSTTYWLQTTGDNGCINTDTITITANPLPVITHSNIVPICSNDNIITLNGGNPTNGYYSGLGVSGNSFNPTITGIGTHSITYHVTNENGCSDSLAVNIVVNAAPVVDLGDDSFVNSDTILDAGAGYVSYIWNDGSSNQTLTTNGNGSYSVTVTDANGCSGSDTIVIHFTELIDLIVSELISPNIECSTPDGSYPIELVILNRGRKIYNSNEQVIVNIKANSGNFVQQNISLPEQLIQNQSVNLALNSDVELNAGEHQLSFFVEYSSTQCDTTQFEATINQSPSFTFNDDTLKVGLPYEFNPNITGNYSYLWSTGSTSPTLNITQFGTYWLRITDANSCSTSDTICIISTSIGTIPSINTKVIAFPNPASRLLNVGISSDEYNKYSISVISPNGIIVWQNETPNTNSHVETINVSDLTPGIYFVKISSRRNSTVLKVVISR